MQDLLQTYPGAAVAALILGFGFLILIHELGHFLVAKWAGIRATQFAIGFGPAIASFRKGIGVRAGSTEAEYERRARAAAGPDPTDDELYAAADAAGLGETEYRLNWLPLGGYVKMLGQEDLDPAAASQDPRAYNQKPIWKRMAVISAGVVMNLLFGIVFLVAAFGPGAGVSFPAPIVGSVTPGAPAAITYATGHEDDPAYLGLLPGDRVLRLNDEPVEDLVAVMIGTALGGRNNTVRLAVERPGEPQPLPFAIQPRVGRGSNNMLAIGIQPASTPEVSGVPEDGPLAEAGLAPGDRLVRAGRAPAAEAAPLQRAFAASGGEPVELVFASADGTERAVTLRPEPALARDPSGAESLLGLEPLALVQAVEVDSPAEAAGLQPGDVLARVGSRQWPGRDAVLRSVAEAGAAGAPLELVVLRDEERVDLPPALLDGGRLGIAYGFATGLPRVATPAPTATLALPGGSRIDAIGGEPVEDFAGVQRHLQRAAEPAAGEGGARLSIRYTAPIGGGSVETLEHELDAAEAASLASARWQPPRTSPAFHTLRVLVVGDDLAEAAAIGLDKTGEFVRQTYATLLRLIQGDVKVEHLRGPVGIVDEGSKFARDGWPYFFYFLGIISINLAVINFLPLPIVDGGHMVFLAAEKIRGKPAGERIQTAVTLVGLCLIAGFFLVVTYNDIFRMVTQQPG